MAKRGYKETDPIIRFNQQYIVDEETGCWNWQYILDKDGYGKFRKNTKIQIMAHRFSYEYYVGPLKKGFVVCHNCQNRKCVNYNHLRQDTQSSNCIDKSYFRTHNKQILSVDEVIEIKKALLNPYFGQNKDLAHFYKVSKTTISSIKTGRIWSYIDIS
jgi:hypothetical protein